MSILIKNARMVNEGSIHDGDMRVRHGRIDKIAASITAKEGEPVIDAEGSWLLPGVIDDQVHFREPGLTAKGDMATESAAAVAGGTTSFMEMPNVKPLTTSLAELEAKYERADGRSHANYAFYLGATNDNIDVIRAVKPGQACGIKVFMGASTGAMLVDDDQALEAIFADAPILIATHCEDTPTILANEQAARERFGEDVPIEQHPLIRSEEACYLSSSKAIDLAKRHDARLHVLHLTTERELAQFEPGATKGKRITAEGCVHHMFYSQEDYAELGSLIKCNPAIKKPSDRAAIIQAVIDGRIDVIATDHAPHTAEEKAGQYFSAPAGLPLVQHSLLMTLEHVWAGTFGIELAVQKTSHTVADMFGIQDRGYLREGWWADLVLVDPNQTTQVRREGLLYKCGWSPLEGHEFGARIITTLVNGQIAWDGRDTSDPAGQRLAMQPD